MRVNQSCCSPSSVALTSVESGRGGREHSWLISNPLMMAVRGFQFLGGFVTYFPEGFLLHCISRFIISTGPLFWVQTGISSDFTILKMLAGKMIRFESSELLLSSTGTVTVESVDGLALRVLIRRPVPDFLPFFPFPLGSGWAVVFDN